jgi:flavin reductase (DIM6/NTAB) family NADH-FMN oxidoreductase RutF
MPDVAVLKEDQADRTQAGASGAVRLAAPEQLRRALGTFATGVTVVTLGNPGPHGMTANSFTSVSLDPALVLVCVDRTALTHTRLARADCFGVSVLAAGQETVATHFADRRRHLSAAEFGPVPWTPGPCTAVPLIDGALAWFECRTYRRYPGGDHTIVLGEVLSADVRPAGDGLLFAGGRFRQLLPQPAAG